MNRGKMMLKTITCVGLVGVLLTGCSGSSQEPTSTVAVPSSTTGTTSVTTTTSAAAPTSESTTSSAAPAPTDAPADATALATKVKAGVPSISKIVTITEDNDANNKIGRPGGYVSAATMYDSGAKCTSLGADCGATIEVFPTAEEAQARSDYIQSALKANPILGNEYDYLRGPALLRVSGDIKPSIAKTYEAAFQN